MKSKLFAIVLAVSSAAAVTFASSSSAMEAGTSVTRAQVRHELVQLEKVGYYPARGQDLRYPDNILQAVAKLQNPTGDATAASSHAQRMHADRVTLTSNHGLYFGH